MPSCTNSLSTQPDSNGHTNLVSDTRYRVQGSILIAHAILGNSTDFGNRKSRARCIRVTFREHSKWGPGRIGNEVSKGNPSSSGSFFSHFYGPIATSGRAGPYHIHGNWGFTMKFLAKNKKVTVPSKIDSLGLGQWPRQWSACTSTRTCVWSPAPMQTVGHSSTHVKLVLRVREQMDPWGSPFSQASQNTELQVHWETLSQKIK